MEKLRLMKEEETMKVTGGGKEYGCPWNDYWSQSYWKTYGHAIAHAYQKGYFTLPFALISKGLGF